MLFRAALLVSVAPLVAALGQKKLITFESSSSTLQIAGGSIKSGQILVSENDYWGVIRAAGDLAVDFGRVTGTNYTLSNGKASAKPAAYTYQPINNANNAVYSTTGTYTFEGPRYVDSNPANTVIIAGTIGNSSVIDSLIAAGKLNVDKVKGQWEASVSQRVKNPIPGCAEALVLAGADPRGTIFAIYDVSEQIGVSPWYFWADVPTSQHKDIYVLEDPVVTKSPSVKYRGIFLNDEQPGLTNWVANNFNDTAFGPGYNHQFYSLVFELLLRLRANYLWPAVWATMFEVDDALNQPRADAYEIVVGSSHTEPMMRAQNEFKKFYPGDWAYNLNNATIDDYFRYGVARARPYARNSLWTMGMRGTGDTAIAGLGLDKIITMLETLVDNQGRIIEEGLGVKREDVPQSWVLYKEVQSYLIGGLKVPDHITLTWPDDNWGNIKRLPLKTEMDRAGGAGVYYHFDYVGDPRDYKWISTIQLEKTAEQMHMAYARKANRIWVVNVGDLKPEEIPINHFMDMAWDAERWGVDTVDEWTEAWAAREFGAASAKNIADILIKYGMYAGRRKVELVEPQVYSVLQYNEANAVLEQWAALRAQAQSQYDKLPEAYKPAFFQMILHPIIGSDILYNIQVNGAKNMLYAGQKRNSANDVIKRSLELMQQDAELTNRYHTILGGKWNHMMDQTHLGYDGHWQQPMRNSLPAMSYVQTNFASLAGEYGIAVEGSNATVSGDDKWHSLSSPELTLPQLDPYGPATRYFEVFSRGNAACVWNAKPEQPWLKLSAYTGTVGGNNGTDTKVFVSVDWASAPQPLPLTTVRILITSPCRGFEKYAVNEPRVLVPVVNRALPSTFGPGFVEGDGVVSIEAPHYNSIVKGTANATYHTFRNYGRTFGGVGLFPMNLEKLDLATAPALDYNLYLFTGNATASVTLYISPSHNYLGDSTKLEYAVALFKAGSAAPAPTRVQPIGDLEGSLTLPRNWGFAVADSVWGVTSGNSTTTAHKVAEPGAYTLRIWTLLPSLIIQKVIVDVGGLRPSYLGPPESFWVGEGGENVGSHNGTSFLNGKGTLGGFAAKG